jgi:hypothetical protein
MIVENIVTKDQDLYLTDVQQNNHSNLHNPCKFLILDLSSNCKLSLFLNYFEDTTAVVTSIQYI